MVTDVRPAEATVGTNEVGCSSARVGRCEGCPFAPGPSVGPRGNPMGSILIVGEAPGANELRDGIPFIGPSGKLLKQTAAGAGFDVDGDDVYITNALRCLPPKSTTGGPPRAALEACRDRLLEEVTAADRRLILALGNSALRSLTGNWNAKITQERGRIIHTEFGPVLPILHPAAILRNTKDFATFRADFMYAGDIITGRGQVKDPGEPLWQLVGEDVSVEEFVATVRQAARAHPIAADIETSGTNAYEDYILCVGITHEKNRGYVIPEHLVRAEEVVGLLGDPDIAYIWHNGKFDTTFLQRAGIPAKVTHDTMLIHYCLDERGGIHGLKDMAANYLGAPDWEADLRKYVPKRADSYALIPSDVIWDYLAHDTDATFQLFDLLYPRVQADKALNQLYHKIIIPASNFLQRVEQAGIWVNPDTLDEVEKVLDEELQTAYVQIQQASAEAWDPERYAREVGAVSIPGELNPLSPKQLQWLLYSRSALGLRPPKGRERNTREDTIKEINDPSGVIAALLKYREIAKLKGTYNEGIRTRLEGSPDGRIHSTFLLHGTQTGRLASRDPNLQNVPRPGSSQYASFVRDQFQAPADRRFIELDYSQAELRVLAHLSGDEFLTTTYREGRDLHDEVSVQFFGEDFTQEQRMRAKAFNFGIAYGRGEASIADEFNIPIAEARMYRHRWFAAAADAGAYILDCRATARKGGTITTPFGRKRRFQMVTQQNVNALENEAANFPIQSTASDLTLLSGMRMQPYLESQDATIINLVHDSILIECPDDDVLAQELVEYAIEIMVDTPRRALKSEVPFLADAKMGYKWGSLAKYKG